MHEQIAAACKIRKHVHLNDDVRRGYQHAQGRRDDCNPEGPAGATQNVETRWKTLEEKTEMESSRDLGLTGSDATPEESCYLN